MYSGLKTLVTRTLWTLVLILGLLCSQGVEVQAAEEAGADQGVQIKLSFGTGIDGQQRTLSGEAAEFPADCERVFCYTHVSGADAPTTLTHAWYFQGKTKARVDLNIGAANWRTWSSKRIMSHWVGLWEVKVLDDAGQVLASGNFTIK